MACAKQTARMSCNGLAPRKQLATGEEEDSNAPPPRPFVISGCGGYAAHMNGTYVARTRRVLNRVAYRCVENPRVCVTFCHPSKFPVPDRRLQQLDEELAMELKAHNQFSGWVVSWNAASQYREPMYSERFLSI